MFKHWSRTQGSVADQPLRSASPDIDRALLQLLILANGRGASNARVPHIEVRIERLYDKQIDGFKPRRRLDDGVGDES
jgi:hypothetical protein